MSDPVVVYLFPNPQVFRVGLALVGLDQTAISIFWAWTVEVKLGLSFLLWLLSMQWDYVLLFYQDGYYVLDSCYGFVM